MPETSSRTLNGVDRFISQFDRALRSLTKNTPVHTRSSPAQALPSAELNTAEQKSAVGLMRVNHSGEVCAQALYQGQALTARLANIRSEMEQAAVEELDHLAWCEERITQLGGRTSVLNPIWYGLSFGIGAGAGLISDRVSLGFVAATEDQVCHHLQDHLKKLPESDVKSRAIVEVMLEDEHRHGKKALDAGGYRFPAPIKAAMRSISKIMTAVSYRI